MSLIFQFLTFLRAKKDLHRKLHYIFSLTHSMYSMYDDEKEKKKNDSIHKKIFYTV